MRGDVTLYDRLGGDVGIEAAVDRLHDVIGGDPELAPFFDGVDVPHVRAHQKAFLAVALGGPDRYHGRELADAHRQLAIHDRHVRLLAGHLAAVLAGLGVAPALIDDAVAAVTAVGGAVLDRR